METPASTGKVKVEYSDPSGVYQLIASELQPRLPLKTLNWTSASRPTRSIDSLYVEIVPDEKTTAIPGLKRSASSNGGPETPTSPSVSGEYKRQETQSVKRERRHQIPGLRRTPYLKIYFLRCDDSDTYKATARKAVREWIKSNSAVTQAGSTSNQDNHDAFEYMIVHVVLPDVQTGASWPTKSSSSVLEKLKSDFNSSSRNSPDRIVQIPSMKSLNVQGITVNPVPSGTAKDVFLQDSARAWDDLIAKMKLLILNSFDNRVKQYEEDIKEKGNQRILPGWNFCTFFVLKEGLARGFESVGLVDDALMGYDELSVELLSAVREENSKESRLFREHTQELLIQAEASLQGQDSLKRRSGEKRLSSSVLEIDNKPYRELILANNISIFDFRSYVFARQTQIMLRLASLSGKALKANSSAIDITTSRDPVILADICWRAKEFFADIARVIRLDLKACFKAESDASEQELKARFIVTENLIASWTYKGAIDILNRTREANLPDVEATEFEDEQEILSSLSPVETSKQGLSPIGGVASVSLNGTSLPSRSRPFSPASFRSKERLTLGSVKLQSAERPPFPPGASSLAAERAELYLIARRALSSVGERQGWETSWPAAVDATHNNELDDVTLTDGPKLEESDEQIKVVTTTQSSLAGVLDPHMIAALADRRTFYEHWEQLSLLAFLLFEVAQVRKSVYLITADIAAVRVRLEDYAYAAPFLRELGPQYTADQWLNLEVAVLDMYVFCLKKLNQPENYVPATLQMLSRAAKMHSSNFVPATATPRNSRTQFSNVSINSIVEASIALPKPVHVSLDEYFSGIRLEQSIQHSVDSDEYSVALHFNSNFSGSFQIDQIDIKISSNAGGLYRDIILSSAEPFDCVYGVNIAHAFSKTMYPDWYNLDSINFISAKINFFRTYKGTSFADRELQTEARSSRILIWPSARACSVDASVYDTIQLEQPRSIVFQISSNHNNIKLGKLIIKSGTAGLRLQTSDAEIVEGDCLIIGDKQPSTVPLGTISATSVIKIRIPYRIEGDWKEINVRSELSYEVDGQTFLYFSNHQLVNQLPLGVNVQDIFKKNCLFSKFSISTSSDVPIQLLSSRLDENDMYNVSTPYLDNKGIVIFPQQPVSLVYRIVKSDATAPKARKKLSLRIDYQCLDEQVIATVTQGMVKGLEQSSFNHYSPLLLSRLKAVLRQETRHQDLERVGLLGEITIPSYEEMKWEKILLVLPTDVQPQLSFWLKEWHSTDRTMTLGKENRTTIRHIEIPVEIPALPILHTASLTIGNRPLSSPYTVGGLLKGELQISHTRYWSSTKADSKRTLSFIYELEASPETWLIAGQRRAYFTAIEGELKSFPILLLPMRAGKLMLPVVEIRMAKEDDTNERIACETDYQSHGTAIEVVPGIKGVSLDVVTSPSGGLDGEVKVLEVERDERVFT